MSSIGAIIRGALSKSYRSALRSQFEITRKQNDSPQCRSTYNVRISHKRLEGQHTNPGATQLTRTAGAKSTANPFVMPLMAEVKADASGIPEMGLTCAIKPWHLIITHLGVRCEELTRSEDDRTSRSK